MPVSGTEEPGVIARRSSSFSAGVPIKKRKFPIFRPPSPQPQESPSSSAGNDSVETRQSCPDQQSSLLNASPVTSSFGKSDVSKNSLLEVKQENAVDTNVNPVQNSGNLREAKAQESKPKLHSGSTDNLAREAKLMPTEKSVYQKVPESTGLHLAHNEGVAVHVVKEEVSKQRVGIDCKLQLSSNTGNVGLSLGQKEPLVPALAGQDTEGVQEMRHKLDPSSLCLSLSKEKDGGTNDSSDVRANRSNWDLNTTMDAWEGSVGDAAVPDTIDFNGSSKTGHIDGIKAFACSTGMLGIGVESGKQIHEGSEHGSNFPISSSLPSQQYRSEDSVHLSLNTSSCQSTISGENCGLSAKVDSGRVPPNANSLDMLMSSVGCRTVKGEPLDENAKCDSVGFRGNGMELLGNRNEKTEFVERSGKLTNTSIPIVDAHKSIKPEPVQESNHKRPGATELMSQELIGKIVQCPDGISSSLMPPKSYPSGLFTCSELSINRDVTSQSEYSTFTEEVQVAVDSHGEARGRVDLSSAEMGSTSAGQNAKRSKPFDLLVHRYRAEDSDSKHYEACVSDELHVDSRRNGEGSESDEGKINISADTVEEDCYGSDYDSDGNQAVVAPTSTEKRQVAREDDEYEDGEVREPIVHTAVEGAIDELREAENVNLVDCDDKNLGTVGCPRDVNALQNPIDEISCEVEDKGEASDVHIKDSVDNAANEKADQVPADDGSSQRTSTVELATAEADDKRYVAAGRPLDPSGRDDTLKGCDTEELPDRATSAGKETKTTVGDEHIRDTDMSGSNDLALPKVEVSRDSKDATKDAIGGGNRSRIINLPRASNVTSPYRVRSISDKSLISGTGRGRYNDIDEEKSYPRRNRDEFYTDGPRKFLRERFQDQPPRSSRLNFVRGRGRVSSGFDSRRGEWESDRDFAPDSYNDSGDYRFPRHKRAAVGDEELECSGYGLAPDGAFLGANRGGRKHFSDESPSFRHPSSRRPSPGSRDGPAARGMPLMRRIPRNISSSRCNGEDNTDLVGIRHNEKFRRGLADDVVDPYEGLDGQFARGNRNFSSVQRRVLPRIRSKSPIRSRTRSPGPWSSPGRRSPDGFTGLPELSHRRSPPIYRMERIRSPDRSCFPEEMVGRRRGSPPYVARPSNDLRDMDSERIRVHPRSVIPGRRSPADRVLPRSARRFDILDSRERTDNNEYFGGPTQSGRFNEVGGDRSGDDRRKFGERRGLNRSFRPPLNSSDGEDFRFQLEDGPRPYRFCQAADSEIIERSNLREREFERRRPVIAPRRMRGIEDQEGNYRPGGKVWHDDGFDDGSRVRRRRF